MWRVGMIVALLGSGCGRVRFSDTVDATATDDADTPCAPQLGLIGDWSLDATSVSNATARDRSSAGHDGLLRGTPPPVVGAGRVGEGLDYTATTIGYVDLPGFPVDSTMGAFNSVSLWFRHDDPTVDETLIYLPSGPGAGAPRYDLWLTDRIGPVSLCINTGTGDCWGVTDPGLIGRWVHVVAVFANGRTDGGTMYLDGAPVAIACVFGVCDETRVAQAPVAIGGSDATYAWHGHLDEVRFYDRALTGDEAGALASCGL